MGDVYRINEYKLKRYVMCWKKILTVTFLFVFGISVSYAQQDVFLQKCKEGSGHTGIAVPGIDGWYFLKSELRHLSVGPFWGSYASKVSRAVREDQKDPLKAIVSYNQALSKEGVALIVVPIPPKAIIYPEKLSEGLSSNRYDETLRSFYEQLKQSGVQVIDLYDALVNSKNRKEPLYCLGDSHISGEGCLVVAQEIAKQIKERGKSSYHITPTTVTVQGDLYKSAPQSPGEEQRTVYVVSGDETKDSHSSVLLLGDSHTLVFDAGGDMFSSNGGIASLLASELKMPVDVIGVRGSGATPARINLMRRSRQDSDFLKEKKVVVWCFSAREFTESSGWNSAVPVK